MTGRVGFMYLFWKRNMLEKVGYRDVVRFSWNYWRKRPRTGTLLVGLMVAATVVDVFVPIYTGKIIDALVTYSPGDAEGMDKALHYLLIFVALGMSYNVLRWASVSLWNWYAVRNLYEIVTDAMQKVQRFSADWHANTFAGGTVRKITRGMWSFDVYGDTLFFGLAPSFIIMIGMTTMLMVQLPWVGLFVAFMIALYSGVSIWLSVFVLAPQYKDSAKADTKVGATLADIITGNPTVKAFGAESREDQFFNRIATLWRLRSQRAWLTSVHTDLVRGILRMTMMGGMVGVTVWMWENNRASPGDIALSLVSFFIIGGYLRDIGQHIANLQRSVSEMEDVISFWMNDSDLRDPVAAKSLDVHEGGIVFDHVRFAYKGAEKPLFEDLSVTIRPGEKVALVGHSGSGKSTFVKLVQRLYDVQGGAVRIDGQDVADVTQESLRRNIALVPQEPILFHRSLASNIAYGRPGAKMADIIAAAKKAYAHDFICAFPQGYDTLVGERGVKLSGGERQRVAIARAILADTPILILDEATSSLDSVSEHYIQMALAELMKGRTTITVAHRLSTIKDADRILVFDKGRIAEQGTHEALLKLESAHYRRLYEMQAFYLTEAGV
jgi:ATP-binding cassette subfamily B protein